MADQQGSALGGSQVLRDDTLTLSLRLPIYQGGAEYARVREAKTQHAAARQDMRDSERRSLERARQAWYNYIGAGEVIRASRRSADASLRALQGVQEEQREGLRTMLDVLDAQAEFLSARLTQLHALRDSRVQAYRLMSATGQLTVQGMGLNVERYDPKVHYDDVALKPIGF